MDPKNVLSTVQHKISPVIQVLLLFKFNLPKGPGFMFIVLLTKYIAVLSLSDNFSTDLTSKYKNNYFISDLLRKGTAFLFIKLINVTSFYFISLILLLMNIAFIGYIISYLVKIHKKKNHLLVLDSYPHFFCIFVSIFAHYILEFYSYSILFVFRKSFTKPTNDIFSSYSDVTFFQNKAFNIITVDFFAIFNAISYFLVNFYLLCILYILNSPFHSSEESLNVNGSEFQFFVTIVTNFSGVHFFGIFIQETHNFYLSIMGIIFFLFFFNFLYCFYSYDRTNFIYKCYFFFNQYILLSIILCFISFLKEYTYTKGELVLIFFLKIIFSLFLSQYFDKYRDARIYTIIKNFLFEQFDQNHSESFLTMYRYLVDILIRVKTSKKNPTKLLDVIISHQEACQNENCKCKVIQAIPTNIFQSQINFSDWLIKSVGFLFESSFGNINLYSNYNFPLILSDYYYHVKDNLLFGFSITTSCLCINYKKMNYRGIIDCYGLKYFFYCVLREKFKNSQTVMNYNIIFNSISERSEFTNNLINYLAVYDSLIDAKINFETSLKFSYDNDSSELQNVTCPYLTKGNIYKILGQLKNLSKLIDNIKRNSEKCTERKTAEFYYIVYSFYYIFNGKIPKKIRKHFESLEVGESFSNITPLEVGEKLENYLTKYFSTDSSASQIIVKLSKGMKIKYFSANLCTTLGYIQSNIIGEDFNSIFPKCMRESHTKAMMHFLMYQKNYFYHGSTFIFSQKENAVPCYITGAALPHLGKALLIISEVKIKHTDKKIMLLDNNLSGISICKEIEDKYLFNLKLLKKCDTEITDIFDVHSKIIRLNFAESISLVTKIQNELRLNAIDQYSRWLFFQRGGNEFERFDKRLVLDSNSLKINNSNDFTIDASLLKNKKKRQKFYFVKDRETIIQNIIKAFNKISDSNLKEEKFKRLSELVPVLTYSLSNLDKTMNKLSIIPKKKNFRNSVANELELINRMEKSTPLAKLQFKVTMRMCYDMPIFVFKLKDSFLKRKKNQKLRFSQSPKSNRADLFKSGMLENNKMRPIGQKNTPDFMYEGGTDTGKLEKSTIKENIDIEQKTFQEKPKEHTSHIPKHISKNKLRKINAKRTEEKLRVTTKLLLIICFILMILIVIICYVGIRRMENSQVMINFYFRILFHRDKITYLESYLLGLACQFSGYSHMNFTDEEMMGRLKFHTVIQEEAMISFYKAMNTFNEKTGIDVISILQNKTFYKIIKNWQIIQFNSDYISEMNYVIYLANLCILENSKESIAKDADLLFLNKWITDTTQPVYSSFGMVLFFLSRNIQLTITEVITELLSKSKESLDSFVIGTTNRLVIYQSCWLGLNVIFCILFYLLIKKFNKRIYKIIILMFFDKGKNIQNNLRTNPENYFMKQKVKLFEELVKNFSDLNRKALKDFKPDTFKKEAKGILLTPSNEEGPQTNQTNTTTNSVSLTSQQINSNNNILTSNSLLRSKYSGKLRSLANVESLRRRKSSKVPGVSAVVLSKSLTRKKVGCISMLTVFLVTFYLVCILVFFALMLNDTLYFKSFMKDSTKIVNTFTTYFSYLSTFIVPIRMCMIQKVKIPQTIIDAVNAAANAEIELNELSNENYLKLFSGLELFSVILTLPYNASDPNFMGMCYFQETCFRVVSKENSYCSDSLILGFKVVIQKFLEISSDYNNFKENNPNFDSESFKNFLESKDFTTVQENVDFVFSDVQTTLYMTFLNDYEVIKGSLTQRCVILYSIGFSIQFLLIIVLVFWMIGTLERFVFKVLFGSILFNFSFYRNVYDTNE